MHMVSETSIVGLIIGGLPLNNMELYEWYCKNLKSSVLLMKQIFVVLGQFKLF